MDKPIQIAGIPIDNLTVDEVLGRIETAIAHGPQTQLATVNPEMILEASRNPSFLELLRNAQLRTPDGIGILWASHLLQKSPSPSGVLSRLRWLGSLASILFRPRAIRHPIRERVTGTDLMKRIATLSGSKGWSLFLLGAREGVAEAAIQKLTIAAPEASFVGCFQGSPDPSDDAEVLRRIHLAQPQILFVAYGSPAQEFWIRRNLPLMPSVRVAIGVGGAFDFHSGMVRRAPALLRKVGLEWLWRLIREPRRFKRIWRATVTFPLFILGLWMESR
ncbi:WecB/TagA/CpsF family glycosyltransferase [Candidatus Peregrinibacteria bacterium]|nr:WecB/TagA/CpsF family glycosyltransferase [Candidatus Peregrinibacteria bacterium]